MRHPLPPLTCLGREKRAFCHPQPRGVGWLSFCSYERLNPASAFVVRLCLARDRKRWLCVMRCRSRGFRGPRVVCTSLQACSAPPRRRPEGRTRRSVGLAWNGRVLIVWWPSCGADQGILETEQTSLRPAPDVRCSCQTTGARDRRWPVLIGVLADEAKWSVSTCESLLLGLK